MKEKLISVLLGLKNQISAPIPDAEFLQRVEELLEDNALEQDEGIPIWLVEILEAVTNRQSVARTKFEFKQPGKGDAINFLAEFADLIELKFDFYGEGIFMPFPEIRMEALILFEGDEYEIRSSE